MEVIEKHIVYKSRTDRFNIYGIGDVHAGSVDCAENEIKRMVETVKNDKFGYWIGMGDMCLPLDAEILTKNGFKHSNQLSVGEEVISFNGKNLIWDKIQSIYHHQSLPMLELKSKSFHVKCSPLHEWFVFDTHMSRYPEGRIYKKSTTDLKKHHKIIVGASLEKLKPELKLSPEEASILGWIVTDGHIKTSPSLSVSISQSKEPYRSYLRIRYAHWFTGEYVIPKEKVTKATLDKSTFHVKTGMVRKLFAKVKTRPEEIKIELPYIVTRLNAEARFAMLEAMIQAEGWQERNSWHFSQRKGKVLDAFQILATLCGYRLGLCCPNSDGVIQQSVVRNTPVDVNNLKITSAPNEPAWCVKTGMGSFVMRWNGQITITGNCDAILKSDKRFDIEGLSSWVKKDNIVTSQKKWVVGLFQPIANKCLAFLEGNHETTIHTFHDEDITRNLCEDLKVPYGGYSCFIELKFERRPGKLQNGGHQSNYIVHAFHGAGAAQTEGARIMRLMRLVNDIQADIYLMGHLHCIATYTPDRLILQNGKVKSRQLIAAMTGSWLKTYAQPKNGQQLNASYAERKGYKPSRIGAPIIHIVPDKDWVTVEG